MKQSKYVASGFPVVRITPLSAGMAASVLMFLVYFSILSLLQSPAHAIEQFAGLWYWMVPLIIGFGIQVGLFTKLRKSGECVAATGGVSVTSMAACCAHHITDLVPFLGLSAAALFLSKYQTFFLVLGVASNLVGATFMLDRLKGSGALWPRLEKYDTKAIFMVASAFSLFIVALAFFSTI